MKDRERWGMERVERDGENGEGREEWRTERDGEEWHTSSLCLFLPLTANCLSSSVMTTNNIVNVIKQTKPVCNTCLIKLM